MSNDEAMKVFNRLVRKHFGDASDRRAPLSEIGLNRIIQSSRTQHNDGYDTMPAGDRAPTPVERLAYYYRGLEDKGIPPSRIPNAKMFNHYKGFKTAAMLQLFFEAMGYKVEGTRGRAGCTMVVSGVKVAVLSRYKPTRPGRSSLAPSYLFQIDLKSVSAADLFLCWIEPLRQLYVFPKQCVTTSRICINKDVAYATRAQCWYDQFRGRFDMMIKTIEGKSVRAELEEARRAAERNYQEAHAG